MPSRFDHAVQIPWSHIREALDLMELTSSGAFRPVPVGNRVVVKCAEHHDAIKLAAAVVGAKFLKDYISAS